MTVNAITGATQTQEQSTINALRSDLAALIQRRRKAAIAAAHMGSAPGPMAPAAMAGRLRTTAQTASPGINTPAAASEPASAQAPRTTLLQAMGASAQQRGDALGRSLLQAVSLAQSPDLADSIWGQGASQGSALKAQERSAWLHRLMDQLHQDQTLALSDEAEIARSLYLRPGNEAIGPEAVRAGILAIAAHHPHDPEQAAREVLRGALRNGLSAQQIADTGVLTHAQIDRYVQSLLTFFTLDEWTAVRNETIVAAVRPQLDAMGLNGAGVGVRVLEVENSGFHPQTVMAIINQARHGIAPGTAVELDTMYSESYPQQSIGEMLRNAVDNSGLSKERPEAWMVGLRNTLVNAVSGSLNDAAREIREFVYQSGARVMNMSFGSSLTSYYNLVDRMLIFYPKLHNGFFAGVQGEMSESQRMQRIVNFVNDTVLGSDRVMQSYDNYVYATSEAAQSGKTIVVAAGNWQNSTQRIRDQGVGMPPWAAMNVMALSPHVIAVGASSTNGTPHDLMDDTIASFSSNGDEQFPVTLATQGVQAAVSYALFASLDGEVNGTSFAAPLAAGVVALMLQRNPSLSFSQIKSILQAVAVDTPVPSQAEGAGMLDVMAAVDGAVAAAV